MSIARLADGGLVVYSAIALREAEMAVLESFGTPAFLVVPNDIHRMDAKIWKERYPALRVIAPAGARRKVERIVSVDATTADFEDPSVRLVTLDGTDEREAALVCDSASGTTLILNDIIFNLRNRPGRSGWFFQKLRLTGDEPHVAPPVKLKLVKDAEALAAQLARWSQLPDLKRLIVAHGDMIEKDPSSVLARVARDLKGKRFSRRTEIDGTSPTRERLHV